MNLADNLARSAQAHPTDVAVKLDAAAYTFQELADSAAPVGCARWASNPATASP